VTAPIRLTVYGTAKPQGSKSGFVIPGTNRVALREGSSKKANEAFKDWRQAVASAARRWQEENNAGLLDESVQVEITFFLPRPKAAPKWKIWSSVLPDIDKCVRLVHDSLTGTILVNDSRVVRLVAEKLYTSDAPRAVIIITPLGEAERTGIAAEFVRTVLAPPR
jgi:Holliday junction resolvase RusA-like endonuclease